MLEAFRSHLHTLPIGAPSARILVAYSGGADSTCLLHLLHAAKLDIVAAHLHHGQREEADLEAKKCEAFADELGVPFAKGVADVPLIAKQMKIGLEEAGRHARYEFLRKSAFSLECDYIVTGHTRDDQIETILFNVIRGTGLAGLAGIRDTRDNIIRPLLPFSKAETRQYCMDHGFWFHDDPANEDLTFSRARIRHNIIPELKRVHPGFEFSLLRLSEIALEEDQLLDGIAANALDHSEIRLNGDLNFLTQNEEICFQRQFLDHLQPALRKRALRLAIRYIGGSLDFKQTEVALIGGKGSVTAEGGEHILEWDEDKVLARRTVVDEPYRYKLEVPGQTISDLFGWVLEAKVQEGDGRSIPRASLSTRLDRRKIVGELYFRSLQEGDKIQPLGFEGTRKLSDLVAESKLTLAARKRLPIICDMMGPVWVPAICVSERVSAELTGEALGLTFRELKSDETLWSHRTYPISEPS